MTQKSFGLVAWASEFAEGWDRFWFTPRLPQTLAIIRIACGAMLVYVHAIWLSQVSDFMGAQAWLTPQLMRDFHRNDWAWSWLWYVDSPFVLILHQIVAMAACLCMMLGLFTRLTTPLAWWMTLMVCHRMTGALFGLDQITVMLSMYLSLSHCGSVFSLDAWRRRKLQGQPASWLFPASQASVANNVTTRLMQLHLCIIYLFGGLSKMRGEMWYDGSAMWYTAVNYEYQSLDITWLGRFPILIATLTAGTIFWETFYCALVWPRLTRPIALGMAVFVHGGIAIALGMVTFGTIMIVANFAFIEPQTTQRWITAIQQRARIGGGQLDQA
jgi:uncharacterized membrane protein YphA (DoxX/SURF4 family)